MNTRDRKSTMDASAEAVRLARLTCDGWAHGTGSREVQRSGFLGRSELIGDLFVPLWIAEVLGRGGLDVTSARERVAQLRPDGDIHYYRDCSALPWDADDAAAVLLAFPGGSRWRGVARARAVLRAAVKGDGAVRTWVADPDRPDRRPAGPWLGPVCNGVSARALRAMVIDGDFESGITARTAIWLAARSEPDGGYLGTHYPTRVLTTALVLEALAGTGGGGDPVRDAAERAATWLRGEQRRDGAIGRSALETGAAVLSLAAAGQLDDDAPVAAAGDQVGSPRGDRPWPEADVYLCPHPGGAIRPFRSGTLASALALSALLRITRPGSCP